MIDYLNRYSTKKFIWKRIKRTMIPNVGWSLIVIVYLVNRQALTVESLSVKSIVRESL